MRIFYPATHLQGFAINAHDIAFDYYVTTRTCKYYRYTEIKKYIFRNLKKKKNNH